jgi:hypothetical protein
MRIKAASGCEPLGLLPSSALSCSQLELSVVGGELQQKKTRKYRLFLWVDVSLYNARRYNSKFIYINKVYTGTTPVFKKNNG